MDDFVLKNRDGSKISSVPVFAITISIHCIEKVAIGHAIAFAISQQIIDVNRPLVLNRNGSVLQGPLICIDISQNFSFTLNSNVLFVTVTLLQLLL